MHSKGCNIIHRFFTLHIYCTDLFIYKSGNVIRSLCKAVNRRASRTSCRQHGNQQLLHFKGRVRVSTSCPMLSRTWMVNERPEQQTIRAQTSLSSTASNTCCPTLFFTTYWLLVSQPKIAWREEEEKKRDRNTSFTSVYGVVFSN